MLLSFIMDIVLDAAMVTALSVVTLVLIALFLVGLAASALTWMERKARQRALPVCYSPTRVEGNCKSLEANQRPGLSYHPGAEQRPPADLSALPRHHGP